MKRPVRWTRGAGPARWLRPVRAELPLMGCLAVLTGLLALVAAVGPAVVDGLAGRALASRISDEQLSLPAVEFTGIVKRRADVAPPTGELSTELRAAATKIQSVAPSPLRGKVVHDSARIEIRSGTGNTGGGQATFTLFLADDGPKAGSYAEGRPPSATSTRLETAVSTRTRDALKLRLGQRIALVPAPASAQAAGTAEVVGFFPPVDSGLMREKPLLATPLNTSGATSWRAAALIGAAATEQLQEDQDLSLGAVWRLRLNLVTADATPLTTSRGRDQLNSAVRGFQDSAANAYCGFSSAGGDGFDCLLGRHPSTGLMDTGGLARILDGFDADWAKARVIIAFAPMSLYCVGLAACAAAALLGLRRRLADERLRRARGASALRLAGAAALRTAPAAVLGYGAGVLAARLSAPEGGSPLAHTTALAVAAAGWLMLPALTWYALRDGALHAPVRTRTRRVRGAALRRLTAEGAVLLLTVAGVYTLHERGAVDEPDLPMAAVPALLGVSVVVLLVRCYPPPVRAAAHFSARRRGTVPLIALSRAARDAPSRSLALLVLVTTLATAVFGGIVAQTLLEGRAETARAQAGADASYVAERLDAQTVRALAETPGVRHRVTTELRSADLTDAANGASHGTVDLVSADSGALRTADPGSAVGRALAALRADGADIPVLAGPDLKRGGRYLAEVEGRNVRLKVVGPLPPGAAQEHTLGPVRGRSNSRMLLTDASVLGALAGPPTVDRGALLLYGADIDRRALRSLVPRAAEGAAVGQLHILADEQAAVRDDGVLASMTTAFRLCTALTVLLALVALILDLLLSAPERGRTAARLRTMGLGDRATGGLHLVQLLPMVLAAAIGGGALGLFLPDLLGPALDLHGLTGGTSAPVVRADYGAAGLLGAGSLLLVGAAVVVETVMARRRKLGTVLRLGEER
ncbi:hypothetical protein [Streptomyces sp. NPDC051561]|uniref:hypothetical protein n=1 Tax=Streptomyces sp. NPDC051561 TaxID=3365658 RepID=UPI003790D7C5